MKGLETVDQLEVDMEYGANSNLFLFHPSKKMNYLMVVHEGHDRGVFKAKSIIQAFLSEGVTVLALTMPLTSPNNKPTIELPPFGHIKFEIHDQFELLESKKFSPFKYFIQPVTAGLNYCLMRGHYSRVGMVGLSGGGWVTTIYAALDERIQRSYPVAGTLPLELRAATAPDWGDYEQHHGEFYRIANYTDLYTMGSYGAGRQQLQILNLHDPCCFGGGRGKSYVKDIQDSLIKLGSGEFHLAIDGSHDKHEVSEYALGKIVNDFIQNKNSPH